MLQSEREFLAGHAVKAVMSRYEVAPCGFYSENVRQKFIFLLQAVDRLVQNVRQPLLFTDVLPGFDLVVMQPEGWTPAAAAEFDSRVLSSVDDRVLELLAQALEGMAHDAAGAHVFESQDGLVYFGFQSAQRAEVITEMGISPDSILDASAQLVQGETVQ